MLREAPPNSLADLLADDEPLAARPGKLEGVLALPVDHDLVLRHPDGSVTVLDRTGALIWSCLDGRTDLATTIEDLAYATDVPAAVVSDDVRSFIAELSYTGFLTGGGAVARAWRLQQEQEAAATADPAVPSGGHQHLDGAPTPEDELAPDVLAATIEEGEALRAAAIAAGEWPTDEHGDPLPLRTVTQTFEWSPDLDEDDYVVDSAGMTHPAGIPTFVPSPPAESCMGQKLHLGTPAPVLRVPVGADSVRVRCRRPALQDWLTDAFGAEVVSGTDAVSLHVVEGGAHLGHPFVRLLDCTASSIARGDDDRVRDALWGWLNWAEVTGPGAAHLAVDAVRVAGGVALVDRRLTMTPASQARLVRAGYRLVDQPACAVDPSTGSIATLAPWPDRSVEPLAVVAVIGIREPVDPGAPPGDRALSVGWLCARLGEDTEPAVGLAAVESVVRSATCLLLSDAKPADLLDALDSVAPAGS